LERAKKRLQTVGLVEAALAVRERFEDVASEPRQVEFKPFSEKWLQGDIDWESAVSTKKPKAAIVIGPRNYPPMRLVKLASRL
jgi:hypothetical protein